MKLPESFLEEEERCCYIVTHEMKKVWAVELDLLCQFQLVCKKYGLRYCVDGGTMLGAVRHKGFIPWDDDIDVVMLRNDYDKLCTVASNEFENPYFFQTQETDPGSMRGHAQLRNSETTGILKDEMNGRFSFNQGIFLDIFPLDSLPSDNDEFIKYVKNVHYLNKKAHKCANYSFRYMSSKNLLKRPIKSLYHKLRFLFANDSVGAIQHYTSFQNELIRYKGLDSEYVAKLCFTPFEKRLRWKKSWVIETKEITFEMLRVSVPIHYEEFLNSFFGDWHKFIKGASAHGGVVFDTEKSYKEYLNIK